MLFGKGAGVSRVRARMVADIVPVRRIFIEISGLRPLPPSSFPAEPKRIKPEIVLLAFNRPVNVELSENEIVNGHTAPTP